MKRLIFYGIALFCTSFALEATQELIETDLVLRAQQAMPRLRSALPTTSENPQKAHQEKPASAPLDISSADSSDSFFVIDSASSKEVPPPAGNSSNSNETRINRDSDSDTSESGFEIIAPLKKAHRIILPMSILWNERGRWFLWWPVGFGAGILTYTSLPTEPSLLSTLITSLFFLLLGARFGLYGFIAVSAPILGFALSIIKAHTLNTHFLDKPLKHHRGQAMVDDIKWPKGKARVTLRLLDDPLFQYVQVKANQDISHQINPGDVIDYDASLFPIAPPSAIGAYDYKRFCFFNKISAIGKLHDIQILHTQPHYFKRFRYNITQTIRARIGGQAGEVAAAITTGDQSGISPETQQAFSSAGTSHILAISGLHVVIVAGLIFFALRRCLGLIPYFNLNFPLKKVAACLSLPFLVGYILLSGQRVPAIRALLMITLIMVGLILNRSVFSMRSVMLSASLILIFWPFELLGLSFQMSFAAVIALIAFYESSIQEKLTQKLGSLPFRNLMLYLVSMVLTTLIATIATTPFTIVNFHKGTIQAILGNLIGVPLTGFLIMPLALLSVLSLTWGGSDWAFWLWGTSIQWLINSALWVSQFPGALIWVPQVHGAYLPLCILSGLWLCLWQTRWRFIGVPALIAAQILLFLPQPRPILYVSPQNVAYIQEGILYTAKANDFINRQWSELLGGLPIRSWETPWAIVGDNLIQHPWIKGKLTLETTGVQRQIICHGANPLKNIETLRYKASNRHISTSQQAEYTFSVLDNNEIQYLISVRSPKRLWS